MANDPPPVQEQSQDHAANHTPHQDVDLDPDPDQDSSCPFCTITSSFQPTSPQDTNHSVWNPDRLSPPTYVFLSTDHVVAFLDIAPLTRGHVLVTPRRHRVKIGECSGSEAAELGRILPLVARSVLKAVLPDIPPSEVDYNIVQNNGPGAAQVIPHVHFHIIPRPPLDYKPPTTSSSQLPPNTKSPYTPSAIPTGLKASFVQFGRGQRNELDDEDASVLVKLIRENVKREWETEFGSTGQTSVAGKESITAKDEAHFVAKL